MPTEKVVKHPVIGEYRIIKRAHSRNIRLSINESKGVQITIPLYTSFNKASIFLESNIEWVVKYLNRAKEKKTRQTLYLNNNLTIKLLNGQINFIQNNSLAPYKSNISIKTSKREDINLTYWLITFPKGIEATSITPSIISILRDAAKEYLPNRTKYLASKYKFSYNKLFLKNNKSNWGSCSSLNNINLNIHLMRLPSELCDFIILHELTHLKHRNHSKEFHIHLNHLCNGQERELSKKIKQFSPTIIVQ